MTEVVIDGGNLLCPHCQDPSLHQQAVTVATRPGSDLLGIDGEDTLGAITKVTRDHVVVKGATSDSEYLGRRDDVRITFFCEHCRNHDRTLAIQQHKGQTLVFWILT